MKATESGSVEIVAEILKKKPDLEAQNLRLARMLFFVT
jgi:hypothetical protein